MSCQTMLSLGVYVLGAANADERRRVQAHLPNCRACQEELARIAPLPGLLAGVPPHLRPASGSSPVISMTPKPAPRGAIRQRARGGQWWRTAAAACVAAAAGILTGLLLAPADPPHPAAAGIVLRGTDRALHVSATARLTATTWGTTIELRLSGVPKNVVCSLVVRSRTGATEVGGFWGAWRDGPIKVPASVAWRPSGIASLQVVTATRKLVTIEVHPAPG